MIKFETPLKNALMTAVFWIVQCLGCGLAFCLMFTMMTDTGEQESGGFLPSNILEIHPAFFSMGGVLSVILFAAGWILLLRSTWTLHRHWRAVWTVIWIIQALLGLMLILLTYLFAFLFMSKDLFVVLRPEWAQWFIFPYLLAAVIGVAVDCTVLTLRTKNDNS